ncbi:MAG TPA: septum formation initiator family protein [Terriglobia bacterium]|nr:septum formation initiator family protein [Terriglobia bacterium]
MGQRTVMQGLVSRIAVGVFGLLTVAMLLLAIFDERGALAARDRKLELENINREIEQAEKDNQALEQEIEDLRHSEEEVERRGREIFKLVKPDEVMIELPEAPTPSKKDQPGKKDSSKEKK